MYLSDLQRDILQTLVNKYESRSDYGKMDKHTRRTMVNVNKSTFPNYYHDTNSQYKVSLNKDMQHLQENVLVELEWVRFNEGEELKRIVLNEEKVTEHYRLLGIYSKEERYSNALDVVKEHDQSSHVLLESFYQHVIAQLTDLKVVPSIIDIDSLENTRSHLMALNALLQTRDSEISKRKWSIQLFNDSKKWESIESKIISVLKKYVYPGQDLSDNEILSEFGIIDKIQSINVFGPITFDYRGHALDISLFNTTFGLDTKFIENAEISAVRADCIVTVENMTSFYDYVDYAKETNKNHIVVYLGGFHNSIRRLLLEKISMFVKTNNLDVVFYHWGDIDLGGIRIWKHLSDKLDIPITPIYMDKETFCQYLNHGKEIENKGYLVQLEKMLESQTYKVFHEVIELILTNKRTIEQEIITIMDRN